MLKMVLAAGLVLLAGDASAVKSMDPLTGTVNQGSTVKAIERQDVLDAVAELCRVWNTAAMKATLDPAFGDSDAFMNSFGVLPMDAKLVLIELVAFKTTSQDVVASVRVAVEFKKAGATQRDTPRLVTWTFKRYD